MGLHLVNGTLDGRVADASSRTPRFWWTATTRALADQLSECVQQEASVPQALISSLHLDEKIRRPSKKSFLCSCCGSSMRTHSDPNEKLLRRHQVGSKRPSGSDTWNQNGFETSARESWTSHQRRFDEVPLCWRRHSRGPKASEMYAVFHLRKDEKTSQPQGILYPDRRRTLQ